MSSPGSITMASWVTSSPINEQLEWRGPTGRISWIMVSVSAVGLQSSAFDRVHLKTEDRRLKTHFCGVFAGAAGCEVLWVGFNPCKTEFEVLPPREAKIESVIEVTIKMMADQVVAFDSAVAAPRGPKAVWLPIPPNAAAMSPLLPLCSSTTMIRKKQTIMWTIVIRIIMPSHIPEKNDCSGAEGGI